MIPTKATLNSHTVACQLLANALSSAMQLLADD